MGRGFQSVIATMMILCSATTRAFVQPAASHISSRFARASAFHGRSSGPLLATALSGTVPVPPHFEAQRDESLDLMTQPYNEISSVGRGFALLLLAAVCQFAASSAPAALRVAVLCYGTWSSWEYWFHRLFMHARPKSLGSAIINAFGPYDALHQEHHRETNSDMTITPYEDERYLAGIYFSIMTSVYSFFIGGALVWAEICAFGLHIPFWLVPPAAALTCLYHQLFWNKIHADSHFITKRRKDALPYMSAIPTETAAGKWILKNHIGHHAVCGTANWNIVFPAMDHIFGTHVWIDNGNPFKFLYRKREELS